MCGRNLRAEEIYQAAISAYGRQAQTLMMVEEASELIKAIMKLQRTVNDTNIENIREEMADTEIMLEQMKLMFGGIEAIKQQKIERLKERLGR